MPEKEDGIEKEIIDYFAMMAEFGEELQKYLKSNRDNYEKLFKAKWEMVEAECKKTGEESLKKCNNSIDLEKCFEDFIKYVQEARNELERAMIDYSLKCNESGSKGSELFKKIQKQEDKIKSDTKNKNPEIKIGKQTYKFYDLLMNAELKLRAFDDATMFEEFKNKEFVDDVIEAFN